MTYILIIIVEHGYSAAGTLYDHPSSLHQVYLGQFCYTYSETVNFVQNVQAGKVISNLILQKNTHNVQGGRVWVGVENFLVIYPHFRNFARGKTSLKLNCACRYILYFVYIQFFFLFKMDVVKVFVVVFANIDYTENWQNPKPSLNSILRTNTYFVFHNFFSIAFTLLY